MYVILSHAPNPDIDDGYWDVAPDSSAKRHISVQSFAEASKVCVEFIHHNHLGGGNWTGGQIIENDEQIAWVSYNGRIWKGAGPWDANTEEEIEE